MNTLRQCKGVLGHQLAYCSSAQGTSALTPMLAVIVEPRANN